MTSTVVAFFESSIGIRDAVFIERGVATVLAMLPGLGLEKLAGDGLWVRDPVEHGDAAPALVNSVMVVICCLVPVVGVIKLPLEILLRSEALRVGSSECEEALESVRRGWI